MLSSSLCEFACNKVIRVRFHGFISALFLQRSKGESSGPDGSVTAWCMTQDTLTTWLVRVPEDSKNLDVGRIRILVVRGENLGDV